MKFTAEKKQIIITYILEKIKNHEPGLSSAVISNFHINEATFYKYINELLAEKIIQKTARGKYKLSNNTCQYHVTRKSGDLDWDTIAYEKYLYPHIREFERNVEHIWSYVFTEMTNNVIEHSGAENMDIIVEQNALATTVWMIDDGIGIFKKIKEYFKLSSIDDAVAELFKGKITTDARNHSGEGIFFSSRMMDDFCIVSDGRIFSHNRYDQDTLRSLNMPFKTGTAVMLKLSNHSRKTPQEIFSRYENPDGEFDKTEIKLKMIFESSPVSRSQAKRLCNGLSRFKTIILDFESVEWMGQGFADQIFRVFANEHPQITLSPINMCGDIQKMYRHVTSVLNVRVKPHERK